MSDTQSQPAFHFVCTHEEATEIINKHGKFWVCNCGCREDRDGGCKRSRIDLCLMFRGDFEQTGTNRHEASLAEVKAIFAEAEDKHLVYRPFRNDNDRSLIDGICFCCDCCCEYFSNPDEICDKGKLIERTDEELCSLCGECMDVCYFKARDIEDDRMLVNRDECYGCGLCATTCPEDCIEMVARV